MLPAILRRVRAGIAGLPCGEPFRRCILTRRGGLLLVRSASRSTGWEQVVDLRRDARGHVRPEFLLFPLVLFQ